MGGEEILWAPSDDQVAAAEMTRFRHFVNSSQDLNLTDYPDLHE